MKLTDLLQKVFYVLGPFKWKMRPIKDMTFICHIFLQQHPDFDLFSF